ncbi:extracellular solute-binding protein [Streptomyces sp. NPDC051207]|uniref:extracellular solute-binding protein n=1 Tax=Streptomyces sp. NPDC051207 TaxID=3154641 RepID=UPI003438BB07
MAAPSPQRTRRRLTCVTAVYGLLSLTACGGVSLTGDGSSTFTTMGYGLGDALAGARMDEARKALGIEIQVNEGSFDEQQFLSSVAADDPPDVVTMDRAKIGGYASRGALLPLDACVKKEGIDLGEYRDTALAEATFDGKLYGLPNSYDSRIMLINGSLLRKHGLTPEDFDTADWGKLERITRKLVKFDGDKLSRIGFDPKIPEFFPMWVEANGGSLISEDGRTATVNSSEAVEALAYTSHLLRIQGGWGKVKALRDSFDMFGSKNQFTREQLGGFPMEDWYVNVLAQNSPETDLVTAPFKDRRGNPVNWTTGYSFTIPKGTEYADEACAFIKTMTSARTWEIGARAKQEEAKEAGGPYVGDFTGNAVADRTIEKRIWKPSGNEPFDRATRLLFDVQADGFSVPANAAGSEFTSAWQKAVNRVLSGQQSPKEALDQAQKQAQSVLDIANQGKR